MKKILLMLIGTLFTVGLYAQVEGIRPTVVAGDLDISGSDTTGEMLWYNHTTGHWNITYGAYLKWSQSTRRLIFGATSGITIGSQTITQGTINRTDVNNSASIADTAFLGDALKIGTGTVASLYADSNNLTIKGGKSGSNLLEVINDADGVAGDSTITIDAAGKLNFGTDVSLYRAMANVLQTDDNLRAAGYLDITGIIRNRSSISVFNKAGNDFLAWFTRNTAGAEVVGDLTYIGNITMPYASTIATSAGILNLNPNTFLGIKTATPYHTVSNYSATPVWALTNTTVNKNVSSAAQAIDSSAIAFDISAEPTIKLRSTNGRAWEITIDATDYALFQNAVSYTFDAHVSIPTTKLLFFDGGSDTYIQESSSDVLDFGVGDINMVRITEGTGIDAVRILNAPLVVDSSIRMSQLSVAPTAPAANSVRIHGISDGWLNVQMPDGTNHKINVDADTVNTPTFTTDIASGVGTRVLVIPAGYWVEAIKIIDVGTTAGLTNIQAVQETSSINLITGKACATTETMLFKTIADHNVYATAKNLTFTATGNSASGMSIVVHLRR